MSKKGNTANRAAPARKVANGLVALSSAAVLAIYAAGYQRTRAAAEQFDAADARRRPTIPAPAPDVPLTGPARSPGAPGASVPARANTSVVDRPDAGRSSRAPVTPVESKRPQSESPKPGIESKPAAGESVTLAPVTALPLPAELPTVVAEKSVAPATATMPADQPPANAAATLAQYKDGTYRGWGSSRHGMIEAFAVIENGRIVRAGIEKCEMRWPCSLIDRLPPQVVRQQSAEVDYVSGATDSTNAFYWGIVQALTAAKMETGIEPASGAVSLPR